MLRQWHEECIEAAKCLPAGYHAIVETQERTYTEGTTYQYEAVVWDETALAPAAPYRYAAIYGFRSDMENIEVFNYRLGEFKEDVERITNDKKQHAA